MVTRRALSPAAADAGCAVVGCAVVALWFPAMSVALHAARSSAAEASAPTTAVKKSFLILLQSPKITSPVSENKLLPARVRARIASHKTVAGRKRRPRNHTKRHEKKNTKAEYFKNKPPQAPQTQRNTEGRKQKAVGSRLNLTPIAYCLLLSLFLWLRWLSP